MAEPLKLIQPTPPPGTSPDSPGTPESVPKIQVPFYKKIGAIRGVIAISSVVVIYLSYYWFVYSIHHITTDNAYVDSDLYPVNTRIMGYVKDVFVSESEAITRGQVLAALDESDFKVELSYKEARYNKALADLQRGQTLIRTQAISKSDLETAEANVASLKADLDGTLLKLKYTQILSPVDGFIGKRTIEPGQYVQPGQSLFVVIPKGKVWIKANFKETQVEKIKIGDAVEIVVDAYPDLTWKGQVESIFPSSGAKLSLIPPENGTGNFTKIVQRIPIKISVEPRQDYTLKPGMSVSPTIVVK